MDLKKICEEVIRIAKPVGNYIKEQRTHFDDILIEKKGIRDFVTEVDKNSERALVAQLQLLLPEAGFITEEKTVEQSDKEFNWIIDPLDGTMNYVHGIPVYAISIALQHLNEMVIGVVYEMGNDECFYTWKGAPSFCNDKPIRVSTAAGLNDALIATGFPYLRNEERTTAIAKTLKYFLDGGRDIRRLGTAATDLCYVACGRLDAYYEGYLNIWDIAAGLLIVENAGGVVFNFEGNHQFNTGEIVACNPALKSSMLTGVQFME